mmetsp:Transcript_50222/g.96963  ORF Transcript_50222/g.96963 Transcript_50222/m.96963 type:complete len:529 (-) Transcript_50222:40-1626(-)
MMHCKRPKPPGMASMVRNCGRSTATTMFVACIVGLIGVKRLKPADVISPRHNVVIRPPKTPFAPSEPRGLQKSPEPVDPRKLNRLISSADDVHELLEVVKYNVGSFQEINVGNALVLLARTFEGWHHIPPLGLDSRFQQLVERSQDLFTTMQSQALSNVVWSLAKLRHYPGQRFLKRSAAVSLRRLHRFKPKEMTSMLWAYGKLDFSPGDEFMEAWLEKAERELVHFNLLDVAMTVYSFGTLRYHPKEEFMTALLRKGLDFQEGLTGQQLPNLVWACAKLEHHPGDEFLNMVVKQMGKKLDTFNPGQIGTTLWALSRFDIRPDNEFLDMVTEQVREIMHEIYGRNAVEQVLCGYASMNYNPGVDVLDSLLAHWEMSTDDGNPEGFTTVLWACTVLEHKPYAGFYSSVINVTTEKLSHFRPRSLSNALWACATSNVTLDPEFLSNFFDAAEARLPDFSAYFLTKTLSACGALKQCRGRLLDKLIETSRAKLPDFKKSQLASNAKVCKQFGHTKGKQLFLSALYHKHRQT